MTKKYVRLSHEKGKSENAFEGLMSRQDYLVVQANDLAKAFGNLKSL